MMTPKKSHKRMSPAEFLKYKKLYEDLRERDECEQSLYTFFEHSWSSFDPANFVGNWHLGVIAEHLEAVSLGQIPRLLINVPPRTAKTSLVSVCFPAWVWSQQGDLPLQGPKVSFFYASYAEKLSLEHSIKTRRLITSKWYQKHWAKRFTLARDTAGIIENTKGGVRQCSGVDARATGLGGDVLIADDPHLVKEAESELVREGVVRWWTETMPSRLNDRATGAMIVVMQRVHEADLSGYILAEGLDYCHLCLPMEFDAQRYSIPSTLGFIDPRQNDGDLLWPGKFPQVEVEKLQKELGPYAYAGQYQQSPAPRGGGILKREWWQLWDEECARKHGTKPGQYPPCEFIVAALDTAYTEKEENDPSALSIWGLWRDTAGNPKLVLMYAWAERYELHRLVTRVGEDCKKFKVDRLLIEDKAAGHSVSQELHRLLGTFQFGVELVNPRTGFIKSPDKQARVQAVVNLFYDKLVYAPDKIWADAMIDQCSVFPRGAHDDLVDTMTMALLFVRRTNLLVHAPERSMEIAEDERFKPKSSTQPLYGGI